jgi:exodeoxyribonuclease VII small subunit
MTFEDAFSALEAAVARLEAGSLSLDESVALYEEGLRLAKLCGQRLDAAELRVRQLSTGADGVESEVPFEENG